ncbi:hypothetical protein [Haloarchaeobius sp. TZWWS8]|uniref:hypothetical protein n=1 Tax=Haloarchaeobius sp. TZWWS8 TaxID=3446121 RepID=UPI003EB8B991
MYRRQVVAGLIAVLPVSAGCTSLDGADDRELTVSDPPAWLVTVNGCPEADRVATLVLAEPADFATETTAVLDYGDLSDPAALVARFAVQHGTAATCSDVRGFSQLLDEVGDLATGPYREEHHESPDSIVIRVDSRHYRLVTFVVDDQVVVN